MVAMIKGFNRVGITSGYEICPRCDEKKVAFGFCEQCGYQKKKEKNNMKTEKKGDLRMDFLMMLMKLELNGEQWSQCSSFIIDMLATDDRDQKLMDGVVEGVAERVVDKIVDQVSERVLAGIGKLEGNRYPDKISDYTETRIWEKEDWKKGYVNAARNILSGMPLYSYINWKEMCADMKKKGVSNPTSVIKPTALKVEREKQMKFEFDIKGKRCIYIKRVQ